MAKHPSSPARRFLYRALLLVVAAAVLAVSLVVFTGATLRLPYLPGAVLEQLNLRLDGYRIAARTGRIAWTPASGEMRAVLRGATLIGPSGGVFLTAESVEIGGQALLSADGSFQPVGAAVAGASAELLTTAEGRTFLLAPTGERLPLAALMPVSDGADPTLPENISFQNGRLSWRREGDAAAGALRLDAARRADGLLEAQIAFDSLPLSLVASGMSGTALGGGQVSVVLESGQRSASLSGAVDFRIEDLADGLPVRGPGSLDVEARIDLSSEGTIERMSGKLAVRDQEFSAAGTETVEVEVAETLFTVDPEANRIGLTGLHLESSAGAFGGRAEFTHSPAGLEGQVELRDVWLAGLMPVGEGGRLNRVSAAVTVSPARGIWEIVDGRAFADGLEAAFQARVEGPDIEAEMSVSEVGLAALLDAWPTGLLPAVRESVAQNLQRGQFGINLALSGPLSDPEPRFEVMFSGADVMPGTGFVDIRNAHGFGEFGGDTLSVVLSRGTLDLQQVLPAWVESGVGEIEIAVKLESGLDAVSGRRDSDFDIDGVVRLTAPAEFGGWMLSGAEFPLALQIAEGSGGKVEFVLRADLSTLEVAYGGVRLKEAGIPGELVARGEVSKTGLYLSSVELGIGTSRFFAHHPESPESDPSILITGTVGPDLLSGLGTPLLGPAPLEARITRRADGGFGFSVLLDLEDTHFVLPGTQWSKPAGAPGKIRLTGTSNEQATRVEEFLFDLEGLSVAGSWKGGTGSEPGYFELENVRIGRGTRVVGRAGQAGEGEYWLRIVGGTVDVDDLGELTAMSDTGTGGPLAGARIHVSGDLHSFHLAEGLWIEDAEGDFDITIAGPVDGTVRGGMPEEEGGMPEEEGGMPEEEGGMPEEEGGMPEEEGGMPEEEGGMFGELPAQFSFKTGPDGTDQIRIEVENAGEVFRRLGIMRNVHGGRIVLSGTPEKDPDIPETYRVEIEDVSIRNAPLYADMLSFISGIGLVQYLLDGETRFSSAEMYITEKGDLLELREGRIEGQSVGMSFAGDYSTATDQIDVQGYAVPARFLSRLLGQVPELGFLAEDESGVASIGIQFQVSGSLGDADLEFQPLTALLPFLPRLLPPETNLESNSPQPTER